MLWENLVVPKEPDPAIGWTSRNIFLKYEERKSTCSQEPGNLHPAGFRRSSRACLLIQGWTSMLRRLGKSWRRTRLPPQVPDAAVCTAAETHGRKTRPSAGRLGVISIITSSSKGKTEVDANPHHQKKNYMMKASHIQHCFFFFN